MIGVSVCGSKTVVISLGRLTPKPPLLYLTHSHADAVPPPMTRLLSASVVIWLLGALEWAGVVNAVGIEHVVLIGIDGMDVGKYLAALGNEERA